VSHGRGHIAGAFHITRDEGQGWNVLHTASAKLVDHSYARHAALITAQMWNATYEEASVLRRVFVYGLLMDRLAAYGLRLRFMGSLHGHRLWESARTGWPYVVAEDEYVVIGQVWALPSDPLAATEALWQIDRAEHVDRGLYRRVALPLADAEPAWVYLHLRAPEPQDRPLGLRYGNQSASVG
jgi:gamma-glutamylcyclotransferase (GGCT)/AIG2-like uncharacterized protein YtfP